MKASTKSVFNAIAAFAFAGLAGWLLTTPTSLNCPPVAIVDLFFLLVLLAIGSTELQVAHDLRYHERREEEQKRWNDYIFHNQQRENNKDKILR